uniref:HTH CENPB-type domain-containing protein n=1 Tax=Trichogramma kaykai TaxID=54128 RepID=A0ABD2WF65_9HYME
MIEDSDHSAESDNSAMSDNNSAASNFSDMSDFSDSSNSLDMLHCSDKSDRLDMSDCSDILDCSDKSNCSDLSDFADISDCLNNNYNESTVQDFDPNESDTDSEDINYDQCRMVNISRFCADSLVIEYPNLEKYQPLKFHESEKTQTIIPAGDKAKKAISNTETKRRNGSSNSHHHTPLECSKGAPTELSKEEENDIAEWVIYCAEQGFPVTKNHLLDCVQKYVSDIKKTTKFKDFRPGDHWFDGFMSRHEKVSKRIAQNLTSTRASVTESDLRNWFAYVKKYLNKKNLVEIDPSRVFNLDESAFALVPKDNNVLAKKGAKSVYQIVSSDEKALLTVLFIASANGKLLPPMILFDCKTTPRKNTLSNIPKGWGVGNTETGWMTAESFFHYVKNCFIPWIQNNGIQLPVVLYVDGHVSHLSLPLMQLCMANQIELIALFPNATHIIQPLDVVLFHQLKDRYRQTLRQWKYEKNIITDFKKHLFAPVLEATLNSCDFTESLKNGFCTTGLFPLDPDAVNYEILNKNKNKKKNSQPTPVTTVISVQQDALNFYEEKILSASVLKSFKKHIFEDNWLGYPELLNHFIMWRKLIKMNDASKDFIAVKDSTLRSDVLTLHKEQINHQLIQDNLSNSDGIISLIEQPQMEFDETIQIEIVEEMPVYEMVLNSTANEVTSGVFSVNDISSINTKKSTSNLSQSVKSANNVITTYIAAPETSTSLISNESASSTPVQELSNISQIPNKHAISTAAQELPTMNQIQNKNVSSTAT